MCTEYQFQMRFWIKNYLSKSVMFVSTLNVILTKIKAHTNQKHGTIPKQKIHENKKSNNKISTENEKENKVMISNVHHMT